MGPPGAVDREFYFVFIYRWGRGGGRRRKALKASRSLPKAPQSLPKASQSLLLSSPNSAQSWPKPSQSLPKASPKPHQSLTKASPKPSQILPRLVKPSIYRGLFEGDLLKCNTYATLFSTLHFIEVKVLYMFSKLDFAFDLSLRERGKPWKTSTSQKCCKVCKTGNMTSQKCCKVCKNATWPVTTLESYGFRCSKT